MLVLVHSFEKTDNQRFEGSQMMEDSPRSVDSLASERFHMAGFAHTVVLGKNIRQASIAKEGVEGVDCKLPIARMVFD